MPEILTKQPTESRRYSMDFAALLGSGEAITGISSLTASPAGLTVSEQAIASPLIQFRIAGGANGTRYVITALVTTDAGNTLEGEGELVVEDL